MWPQDLTEPTRRTASGIPLLTVVLLAAVAVAGCVGEVPREQAAGPDAPMAVYLTDAPANLSRLDVGLESVTAGNPPVPLEIQAASFDLAALRGPEDALLVASGVVPASERGTIEITFAWAKATIGNRTLDVQVGAPLRVDGLSPQDGLLVDIGLPESIQEEDGELRFEPTVKALYALDTEAEPGRDAWVSVARPETGAFRANTGAADGPSASAAGDAANPEDLPAPNATDPLGGASVETTLVGSPVDASAAGEVVGWLVTFQSGAKEADMREKSEGSGAVFVFSLETLPVAYLLATEVQMQQLALNAGVVDVERERSLVFHDAESRIALRMPELTHPLTGLRDGNGDPIDGRGVGVAVVDTGIYAAHADILYEPLWSGGPVVKNLKVESQTFTEMPATDTTAGHGTHVAGIIAGQGSSDPARQGIAPGAALYGLGIGEASTTVWAAQAFDWILQNHDRVDPPIRVVTNSWTTGTEYDPGSVTNRLAAKMADRDLVVVFSAGNLGGDGSQNQVSAQCQIPRAGIVCVAAFDDRGTGTRDGRIADYSSRGLRSDRTTWPDVSAPGSDILSARPPVGTTTGFGTALGYVELSGTSQAAPHVAGVAALMLQMDPQLDGPTIESVLKASAYPFTDGGAYSGNGHHAKGAGLVDAHAAVDAVS